MPSLIRSAIWVLIGVVFLGESWNKIAGLRSAGLHVTPWQYSLAAIWMLLLMFWVWNGFKSWQRYHGDKG